MRPLYLLLIVLAVSAVAVADVLLKRASVAGNLAVALRSPWMVGAVLLYLVQIAFFTYVFVAKVQLIHVGILQTVLYAVIVLGAGFLLFGESLSRTQTIGLALSLLGVMLMNVP